MRGKETRHKASATFKTGAVSLAFLILGYEAALFVHRAAQLRIAEAADRPDTVFVTDESEIRRIFGEAPANETDVAESPSGHRIVSVRHDATHSVAVREARTAARTVETFRFNPNTVSVKDLQRLGFSEKQAMAIDSYRNKGGRFRRRSDFAKSFVVADSVYRRLEKSIDIPLTDLNRADSAAFDDLPGIGSHFAAKIIAYRERLGGYSYPEQLMDIRNFDRSRYDAISDLIICSAPSEGFALWSLDADKLKKHPYIRNAAVAGAIVLFRDNNPVGKWTVQGLADAGILDSLDAARLSRCVIASPSDDVR